MLALPSHHNEKCSFLYIVKWVNHGGSGVQMKAPGTLAIQSRVTGAHKQTFKACWDNWLCEITEHTHRWIKCVREWRLLHRKKLFHQSQPFPVWSVGHQSWSLLIVKVIVPELPVPAHSSLMSTLTYCHGGQTEGSLFAIEQQCNPSHILFQCMFLLGKSMN